MKTQLRALLAAPLLVAFFIPVILYAAMSSTNYYIYADSIGLQGGGLATSTSYSLQDSVSDPMAGTATSSSYEMRGGYQAMDRGAITVTISNTSLDLGILSFGNVNSVSTDVVVTSEAITGYTLSVESVSGSMPAAVTDGSVTAQSEEYGFTASGSQSLISTDVAVAAGRQIASASQETRNATTTLTFKASRSTGTVVGSYSQTINLVVSANF